MDVEQIVHYVEWLVGAILTMMFGLQYSIEVNLVDVLFTADSVWLGVFGLTAFVVGLASLIRLIMSAMDEV